MIRPLFSSSVKKMGPLYSNQEKLGLVPEARIEVLVKLHARCCVGKGTVIRQCTE